MKTLQGVVKSVAAAHTASVEVSHMWRHPLYKKSVKRTKRYACETGSMVLALGDAVEIQPCKPVSKTKKFVVVSKTEVKAPAKTAKTVKTEAKPEKSVK